VETVEPVAPRKETLSGSDLEAACADSTLFAEHTWVVRNKQRFFGGNLFRPRWDIFRPGEKDVLGYAEERNPWWLGFLRSVHRVRNFVPRNYEIHDEDGTLLFKARIPGASFLDSLLGRRPGQMDVFDAEGEPVCSFLLQGRWWLTPSFAVMDPDGSKVGEFRFQLGKFTKMSRTPTRMALKATDGKEWGSIAREEDVEALAKLNSGKKVVVSFKFLPPPPGMYTDMSPDMADQFMPKLYLLCAALTLKFLRLDYMFTTK
jgi:hypothetical protein